MREPREHLGPLDRQDITGDPRAILALQSHRFIATPEDATRYEVARFTVPEAHFGIVRRVWQHLSIIQLDEEDAPIILPQSQLVTDPAFPMANGFAGIRWELMVRRDDGAAQELPQFPNDAIPATQPLVGYEPVAGWTEPDGGNGFFLYPWGTPAPVRIPVSPNTSLCLFVITPGQPDGPDVPPFDPVYRVLGGLLEGEYRQIVPQDPDFRHWFAGR